MTARDAAQSLEFQTMFPPGSTLEQTDPATWLLTTPGPTREEIGNKVVVTFDCEVRWPE